MTADEGADGGPDSLYRRTILRLSALAASGFAAEGAARSGDRAAGAALAGRQQLPNLVGLHAPQVDGLLYGHADEQVPQGRAAEWADAQISERELIAGGGDRSLSVESYTKMVGRRLYQGLHLPPRGTDNVDALSADQLSQLRLSLDRTGTGELSDGDVRFVAQPTRLADPEQLEDPARGIEAVEWAVEQVRDGQFVPLDEIPPGLSAPSMMARDTPDGGLGIETRVDLDALDELLDQDSTGQDSFNLNVDFRAGDFSWGVGFDPSDIATQYELGGAYTIDPVLTYPIDNSSVDRIEITQSVQDRNSSLPLAQNKQTLARVFVDHPESSPIDVEVTIEAKAQTSSGPTTWTSLGTRTKSATVPPTPHSRDDIDDSVNFELPASWRSRQRLIIVAEVDRPGHIGGTSSRTGYEYVVLGDTYNPRVFTGRVDGPNGRPSERAKDFHLDAFRRLMPIDDVRRFWFTSSLINNVAQSDNLISRLDRIAQYLTTTKWAPIDQLFGLTTAYGGGLSSPSWGGGPDNHLAAWGDAMFRVGASTSQDQIISHEINHNIGGRQWAYHLGGPCGSGGGDSNYSDWRTGQVGWSPAYNTMIPDTHPELMSYCNTRNRSGYSGPNRPLQWVSEYRWTRLYNRFMDWTPGAPKDSDFGGPAVTRSSLLAADDVAAGGLAGATVAGDRTYAPDGAAAEHEAIEDGGDAAVQNSTARVISGFLYPDGGGSLLPSFEFPGVTELPVIDAQDPAAILRIGYTDRTVDIPVRASFETVTGDQVEEMGFNYAVPDNGAIRSIVLLDAATEEPLDGYEATDFAVESATVDVPGEFSRDQTVEVGVSVQAQSQVPLHRQLLYSPDGESWLPYTGAFTEDSVPVEFVDGPGGQTARFLLLVSDGVRTQQFQSETFVVPSEPPEVRIARARRLVVQTDEQAATDADDTDGKTDGAADTDAAIGASIENVAGPVETVAGATVSFQAYGTTELAEPLDPSQFDWSIVGPNGQAVTATGSLAGERATHRFGRPGVYTVEVVGTDPRTGLSAASEIEVVVSAPPLASAAAVDEFLAARSQASQTEAETTPTEGDGTPAEDTATDDGTGDGTPTDVTPTDEGDGDTPREVTSPGFGLGSALAALGGLGYALARRLRDGDDEE